MVTSQKIDERKMGNRGSKSDLKICKRATNRWLFNYRKVIFFSIIIRYILRNWETNGTVIFSPY